MRCAIDLFIIVLFFGISSCGTTGKETYSYTYANHSGQGGKKIVGTYVNGYILNNSREIVATYRNGYIMNKSNEVLATYHNGYILDSNGNVVATYANGYIMSSHTARL